MPGLFHKPFRVKSHVKLKSSERKQFLAQLRHRFPGLQDAGGDPELRLLGGDRRCDMFKAKVVAHTDQTGHLYFAAGQPLFYEFEAGCLCPTVYATWRLPELAAAAQLRVATGLLPVLQNGADLMAPGLLDAGPPPGLPRGGLCCLVMAGLCVAVGRAAATAADLAASGGRGKAVLVDHVVGDHLWLRGDQATGPTAAEAAAAAAAAASAVAGGEGELSPAMAAVGVSSQDGAGGGGAAAAASESAAAAAPDSGGEDDGDSGDESDGESAVQSADAHLLNCLLHSLVHKIRDKDLPLLCSSLLANYMSRYSPGPLSLKSTSYKKFGAFAQAMREDGLLEVSNDKGVLSLVSVNRRHPLLQSELQPALTFEEPAAADGGSSSVGGPVSIEDVLFVTAASAELLKRWGHTKGSCLTGKEVRQLVTEYVKAEGLQTSGRQGEVTLDVTLSRLVAHSGRPVLADSLPWEQLFQLCAAAMTPGYRALGPDGAVLLERRGAPARVAMRVESRAGGKSVSLVSGLADFGVDPAQFARTVQRALSVSAGAQANGEVAVQGDQTGHLHRMLTEEWRISKKYISGCVPGAKKKKKSKASGSAGPAGRGGKGKK